MNTYKFDCGCEIPILGDIKDNDGLPSMEIKFDEYIRPDCPATLELLASGRTKGVFQLETPLGQNWCAKLQPEHFEHISALISLLRPGCLKAITNGKSMTLHYVDRKHGREPVETINPALLPILESTYAVPVYQENSIQIAQKIAGFNLVEADMLRKAIGTKDPEIMTSLEKKFVDGCKSVGLVNENEAKEIFGWIKESQRYSFNHCFSGNTILNKNNVGYSCRDFSLETLYKCQTDIEYAKKTGHIDLYKKFKAGKLGGSFSIINDRAKSNKIIGIKQSGKQPTFKVTLECGSSVTVTMNHKFPTKNGVSPLSDLKMGDELTIALPYEKTTKRYNFSHYTIENRYESPMIKKMSRTYTNGSFKDFIDSKKILPNYCQICNKDNCRLETHHIDGNRHNSKIENLQNLCASCHKKIEYQNGRTKKGEKGYPIGYSKIVSIEYIGIEMTYDVEMAAPYHTLMVNGNIMVQNSHAVEYGIISYWTAYAKAHFPVHYLCSCLAYAKEGQNPKEEVAELVEDAKYFNIDVFPPSVKSLFTGDPGYYCVNKNKINFGIGNISGVGPNHVVAFLDQVDLTEKILGRPIDKWSWLEFLIYFSCNINKTVILGLISSGFLSHMGYNRRELLYDYETFIKLNPNEVARLKDLKPTSLKDGINRLLPTIKHKGRLAKVTGIYETLINPPHKLIDDSRFIANKERELLGTPITCQALDDCDKSGANTDCKNVDSVKNPAIAVEIISAREYVIKKGKNMGKKMCYLTVKDDTCSINNVKIYSEKYGQYENMLYDGNTVLLKCYKFDDGLVINEAIEI